MADKSDTSTTKAPQNDDKSAAATDVDTDTHNKAGRPETRAENPGPDLVKPDTGSFSVDGDNVILVRGTERFAIDIERLKFLIEKNAIEHTRHNEETGEWEAV